MSFTASTFSDAGRDTLIASTLVASNLLYVIGSVCFGVPGRGALTLGCWLFALGAFGTIGVSAYTYFQRGEGMPFVRLQSALSVVGSCLFVVGSFVMLPTMTLGIDTTEDVFVGGVSAGLVYIVANVFLLGACLADSAHVARCAYAPPDKDSSASVTGHVALSVIALMINLLGSACFLVGSALWLPDIGCDALTSQIGVYLSVIGSCLFLCESMLPLALGVLVMRRNRAVAAPRRLNDEEKDPSPRITPRTKLTPVQHSAAAGDVPARRDEEKPSVRS